MNRLAAITKHLRRPLHPQLYILTATATQSSRPFSSFTAAKMPTYPGSCYCRAIEYELELSSPDEARTSLCHCRNCKKAFGTNYGLTSKVPKDSVTITKGKVKEHVADNGSGVLLHREFCDNCGSFILEYGDAVKDKFRYICVGSLDDPEALPPKGEFFCKSRASWMPEVPHIFHKREIKD